MKILVSKTAKSLVPNEVMGQAMYGTEPHIQLNCKHDFMIPYISIYSHVTEHLIIKSYGRYRTKNG